ncbi:MAG: ABC transporter permease subunit [Actinobacteria bacterium]|nr:ABC transporter permease subunit [Actinomycetota bacterium]
MWHGWFGTGLGNPLLFFLAVLLGAGLISGEASRGSIFLLLSRPISRKRVLLTKYVVSASALFVVTVLFGVALLVFAALLGHPPSVAGVIISTVLMWLGLLFVLGTALVLSVVLDNTLLAAASTVLVWMLSISKI